ncbi:centriole, cilia and spindle-associated protein [Meleagris gallopavo]|uniref:centriole, cilia and spindle-associated protein n=1 Tax=Meleagris gallopavo TaxID=9103 RepID=UPI000549BEBF|nr:centriole, cilia and spindle-associated protein [Meleagris gallopavo]
MGSRAVCLRQGDTDRPARGLCISGLSAGSSGLIYAGSGEPVFTVARREENDVCPLFKSRRASRRAPESRQCPPVSEQGAVQSHRKARRTPSRWVALSPGDARSSEKERQDQEKHQKEEQEKTVEHTSTKEADKTSTKDADKTSRTGRRPSQSALSSRNDRRSTRSPPKTDGPKENKHPFALYGWGERQTDTGSQKTHNVCASASVNEIHESALRAKNRRQVEKRKLSQRRVRSAEAEKAWRIKPSPPDNPWMTEYMRCYSARAR